MLLRESSLCATRAAEGSEKLEANSLVSKSRDKGVARGGRLDGGSTTSAVFLKLWLETVEQNQLEINKYERK